MADVTKTALASLRKRGITLSDTELHLAVLFNRTRSACYSLSNGEIALEEATSRINDAVKKYHELESASSEDELIP